MHSDMGRKVRVRAMQIREPVEPVFRVSSREDLDPTRKRGLDHEVPDRGHHRPMKAVLDLVDQQETTMREREMKRECEDPRHALAKRTERNGTICTAQQNSCDRSIA